jgi:uncharacterized protein (DUF2267 family)
MSASGIAAFDSTLQMTNVWLRELMDELGWEERHRAYHALRAVLHAIRDRLTIEEVADLGAQLPMLVRGMYYEGWQPARQPVKRGRKREEFLAPIADAFRDHPEVSPEGLVWAVFKVMERHVTPGEIKDVKQLLPESVRVLCP